MTPKKETAAEPSAIASPLPGLGAKVLEAFKSQRAGLVKSLTKEELDLAERVANDLTALAIRRALGEDVAKEEAIAIASLKNLTASANQKVVRGITDALSSVTGAAVQAAIALI